jgi:hypothetical protein
MIVLNTNLEIRDNAYILEYCPSGNSFGQRITIVCYDIKKTVSKYKKANYYLFGSPMFYSNGLFYALTKSMKHKTMNKKNIVISNAMYHIQKSADSGQLQTEN